MKLLLKGLGIIEIIDAKRTAGGDILVKSVDNFKKIAGTTFYKITEVFLTEVDFIWNLVAWLDIPDDSWYIEDALVFQIENQDDVYRLNARL